MWCSLGVLTPGDHFSSRRSDRDTAPFFCLRDRSVERRIVAIGFGPRELVMGKRWDRATPQDIRETSLERLPDNRNESTQIETRSNDLHTLDEIVEVYRQHTRL